MERVDFCWRGGAAAPVRRLRRAAGLAVLVAASAVVPARAAGDAAAGETRAFWEMNLRFKTDSAETGPAKGQPALMPAGMMGDRAAVIFADPAEISRFIVRVCR